MTDIHSAPAAPAGTVEEKTDATSGLWRERRFHALMAVIALLLIVAFLLTIRPHFVARTDDAYVEADVVSLAPRVRGYVTRLSIDDNSQFHAGDELLRIDDRDYLTAVASAAADLEAAKAALANIEAQIAQQTHVVAAARASLIGDRATLTFAQQQVRRYDSLAHGGYGSFEHLQQSQSDVGQRQSAFAKDDADLATARSQTDVLRSQLKQASAEISRRMAVLAQAKLNLSYTRVTATVDGTVANRTVRVGSYVEPGQTLLSEVPERMYVIANFKETQLAQMKVGQAVDLRLDSASATTFHGHIDSFQRGTGSRFALLPPENASGNFVKVVQRVPVKISIDGPRGQLPKLTPGLSVEAKVTLRRVPSLLQPLI